MKHSVLASIIRWTARIIGSLLVIFTLIIVVGELFQSKFSLNTYNTISFIIWGGGLVGLILALWKEGLGGIISVLCFFISNILAAVNPTPGARYTYVFLLFMIPSILYIVYWLLERDSSNKISNAK